MVYFSRGPSPKKGKRAPPGDIGENITPSLRDTPRWACVCVFGRVKGLVSFAGSFIRAKTGTVPKQRHTHTQTHTRTHMSNPAEHPVVLCSKLWTGEALRPATSLKQGSLFSPEGRNPPGRPGGAKEKPGRYQEGQAKPRFTTHTAEASKHYSNHPNSEKAKRETSTKN